MQTTDHLVLFKAFSEHSIYYIVTFKNASFLVVLMWLAQSSLLGVQLSILVTSTFPGPLHPCFLDQNNHASWTETAMFPGPQHLHFLDHNILRRLRLTYPSITGSL